MSDGNRLSHVIVDMAQRLSRIAIGRFNQVQDVVGAILFLASSASDTSYNFV